MINRYTAFIKSKYLFKKTDRILLAVSAGIDSVVMADLFHQAGFNFGIAHCNFGLRGKESDGDETFTQKLARQYKVPFFTTRFNTSEFASSRKISIQMAARELRYTWFEEIRSVEKFDFIATAHHLDDQVETFLINLIRGTGISGLHGISAKQGFIIRPLLFLYRNEIAEYARENRIPFREDSSNNDDKYIRNKIRLNIIPLLEEINPEVRQTITSEIKILGGWEDIGKKEIKRKIPGILKQRKENTIIELDALKQSPHYELIAWEILSSFDFNSSVVSNILANIDGSSGRTFLSPTHRLVADRDSLIIQPIKSSPDKTGRMISDKRKNISWPVKLSFSVHENILNLPIPPGKEFASLDYDTLVFPLEIRKWKAGDSFHPFGMKGKKKVSDLLIDEKISLPDKENTYVLCSSGKIAWVVGRRIDQRFRITPKTARIYAILMTDV